MTAALVEAPTRPAAGVPAQAPTARVSLVKRIPTAWEAYYAHSSRCAECHRRLHNCPAGAALWEAYREARGPILHPFPGGRQ